MTRGSDEAYLALCRAFPPRPIRNGRQLRAAQVVIDRLLDKPGRLSQAEREYLDVLGTLVHEYEEKTVDIPAITGVELLREIMKERRLRQKDLLPVFRTESIASAVLHGRRQLNRRHIEELARFFHISPAAFFSEAGSAKVA